MEHVIEVLTPILEEARFDIEYREYAQFAPADGSRRGTLREVTANQLREVYGQEVEGRNVRVSVRQQVPEESMSGLLEVLRDELGPFIDPGTGRIGHTFPIEGGSAEQITVADGSLFRFEYHSELRDFARSLVQAVAVMGVRSATGALAAWCHGQPVDVQMATVLSGLLLSETVAPRGDIELVPLGLSTAELPRLPMFQGDRAGDCLGLTLVRLALRASPAVFRPHADGTGRTVRSGPPHGVNLELVRDALSLVTNRHVALSRVWLEYPGAWGFCLSGPTSTIGTDRPKPRQWKKKTSGAGRTVITLHDDATPDLVDPREVDSTIRELQHANRKLKIAVDRWRRSMAEDAELEDRYIDLRIALEAIYLKDFANEHSQEMRFRLALCGAWHLGADFEERRSIRKTLRDAYDTASKAVHEGELPNAARPALSTAQDLCRRGILKLLSEGPPDDWGDLALGAELR
ncbi:MAG: HEPN domain-containing protein [Rhodospirillaceae bacterium]|nr:HEPN domain-containing protein [Rhodospirillaceae bacterium]